MMNKFLAFFIFFGISSRAMAADLPSESDIVVCQDQAENYGNGKGDDTISKACLEFFKLMAPPSSVIESKATNMKFYGYRNMVLIENYSNPSMVTTNIIAGNNTELKSIRSLAFDKKNQEILALEESGDVLFFSSKITGNTAPYRILQNKELVGASELVVDSVRDLIMVNNKTTKRILFFSRLANINGRKGKQHLDVKKNIDTSLMDLNNLTIDLEKSELHGLDSLKNKNIIFPL